MTRNSERQRRATPETGVICVTCGGRGALRQGDESYRTCLDCLGQGRLPGLAVATTTAALLNTGSLLMEPHAAEPLKDGVPSGAK